MSYDAIRWAMAQGGLKSSTKFVLVAMADCVNAEGGEMVCWPSYRHLTDRTGQDIKTVEAGLRRLREIGFIVDTLERRGTTGQVVVYRLKTPESGAVKAAAYGNKNTPESGPIEKTNTPESGAVDTAGKTPVFPCKTPVFPIQDPQISLETPPKTGGGTSKGTRKRTSKEPGSGEHTPAIPGVPAELLADWLAVRKAKKAGPLTATAIAGLLREAEKAGLTPAEAVTFCCEAGWQGFNAGWYADRTKGRTPAVPTTSGKHSGFANKNYREGIEADGSFH